MSAHYYFVIMFYFGTLQQWHYVINILVIYKLYESLLRIDSIMSKLQINMLNKFKHMQIYCT